MIRTSNEKSRKGGNDAATEKEKKDEGKDKERDVGKDRREGYRKE